MTCPSDHTRPEADKAGQAANNPQPGSPPEAGLRATQRKKWRPHAQSTFQSAHAHHSKQATNKLFCISTYQGVCRLCTKVISARACHFFRARPSDPKPAASRTSTQLQPRQRPPSSSPSATRQPQRKPCPSADISPPPTSPTPASSMAATASAPPSPSISWPLNRPSTRSPWTPSPSHPDSQQLANGHAISNGHPAGLLANPSPAPRLLDPSLLPHGPRSLSGSSLRSFVLGLTLGSSTLLALHLRTHSNPRWRAPFFLATLSLFHYLEYYTTARYNPSAASTSAFLLSQNGSAYNIAHTLAFLECVLPSPPWARLLPAPFWPEWAPAALLAAGLAMMVVGQATRSLAMRQAGANFNHTVQMRRKEGHELVTGGVYAWLRHPSYFGFWWWGLGTQVVLGNRVCLVGYAVVLWRFFSGRIEREWPWISDEMVVEVMRRWINADGLVMV